MPAPKLTQASVRNIITAATASGLKPSAITVNGDGSLRMEFFPIELGRPANAGAASEQSLPKKWKAQS